MAVEWLERCIRLKSMSLDCTVPSSGGQQFIGWGQRELEWTPGFRFNALLFFPDRCHNGCSLRSLGFIASPRSAIAHDRELAYAVLGLWQMSRKFPIHENLQLHPSTLPYAEDSSVPNFLNEFFKLNKGECWKFDHNFQTKMSFAQAFPVHTKNILVGNFRNVWHGRSNHFESLIWLDFFAPKIRKSCME